MEMGGETVDAKSGTKMLLSPQEMYDAYAIAARILDAIQKGAKLRAKLHALVPKGHKLRPNVAVLVEGALSRKNYQQTIGMDMLRRVAVANQLQGRREFSSRHVVTTMEQQGADAMALAEQGRGRSHHQDARGADRQRAGAVPVQAPLPGGAVPQHLLQTIEALREHKARGAVGSWSSDVSPPPSSTTRT